MTHAKTSGPSKPIAARHFLSRAQLVEARDRIPRTLEPWNGHAGPRFRLEFSPGSVRITSTDLAKKNATENARIESHLRKDADMLLDDLEAAKLPSKRGDITGWSQKSRARMTLRLATIDYSPLFIDGLMPAMVTLTLPGDWERVAPTPDAYRVLVNKFRKRFWNSWGREMPGVWKLEFQHRGAPHLHILTTPPAGRASAPRGLRDLEHLRSCSSCDSVAHDRSFEFSEWLSRTWASVVNHPSEADRFKHEGAGTNVSYQDVENYGDPKRIGVYFSKHGSFADKEYQNVMPELWKGAEGGGIRFWGYWVVRPLIVSQETHEALIMHIVRHLRKLADRASYSRRVITAVDQVCEVSYSEIVDAATGELQLRTVGSRRSQPRDRSRPVRRRVKRMRSTRGFLLVNDSLGAMADIARIISYYAAADGSGFGRPIVPDESGDFFDASPGNAPRSASVDCDRDSDDATESEEFAAAEFDRARRRRFGSRPSWDDLVPVVPGVDSEPGFGMRADGSVPLASDTWWTGTRDYRGTNDGAGDRELVTENPVCSAMSESR